MEGSAPYETALIPDRDTPHGPVTKRHLRRTALGYTALFLIGLAAATLASSPAVQAFGLGLVLPGGGFLLFATGSPLEVAVHVSLALLTVALFLVALFAWFGSGNVLAPIVVWAGSAFGAAAMGHAETRPAATALVPGLVVAGALGGRLVLRRQLVAARARRDRRNRFLSTSRAVATPVDRTTSLPSVGELLPEDLEAMRLLLDRALQPVDEFQGFDWIEQFQTAAVRYQIMALSYALSLTTFTRTPALRGYVSTAQQNLIQKMTDHRVWKYWALENAWGNLRLDPNPIAPTTHDNVMYSGWYAAMIGMYASTTGDDRYTKSGSITLRHPRGHEFVYDFPSLVGILAENFTVSEFCLFPCEPNWIYTVCNNFAAIALKIHDRLRGSRYWSTLESSYRRMLDHEFMTLDGRLVAIRSARTGLTIPALTSTMADAGTAFYLHPLFPDIARRSWEIVRHDMLKLTDAGIEIATRGWDKIDTGNYRRSTATTLASVMTTAGEMGDTEIVRAVRERFEAEHPAVVEAGARHHPGVSIQGHIGSFCARVTRPNGMRDLVAVGVPTAWQRGPHLERVAYPDVLVARAVSDGHNLEVVLYPGAEAGRQQLGLSQLQPGKRYRCDGAVDRELIADGLGRAALAIDLEGRSELRLRPVA